MSQNTLNSLEKEKIGPEATMSRRVALLENFVRKLFIIRKVPGQPQDWSQLTEDELSKKLDEFLRAESKDISPQISEVIPSEEIKSPLTSISTIEVTSPPPLREKRSDTLKVKKNNVVKESTVTEIPQEVSKKPRVKILSLTLDSVIITAPMASLRSGKDTIALNKLKITPEGASTITFASGSKKQFKFLFSTEEDAQDWLNLLQPYRTDTDGPVSSLISQSSSSSNLSETKGETDSTGTDKSNNDDDSPAEPKKRSVFKWTLGKKTDRSKSLDVSSSEKRRISIDLLPCDPNAPTTLRMRFSALNELVQTERNYNKDMNLLVEYVIGLLKQHKCKEPAFPSFVSNIEAMIKYSDMMLDELDKVLIEYHEQNVAPAISKVFNDTLHVGLEQTYTSYCTSYPKTIASLEKFVKDNSAIGETLEKIRWEMLNGLDFHDFFIKPAQRVCKYPLLLKEILKYVPEDDPEYKQLEAVGAVLQKIVLSLNEDKRKNENMQKLQELQEQFDIDIIAPNREFIRSGLVGMSSSYTELEKKLKNIKLFLFSDMVIVANPKMFGVSVLHNFKMDQVILGKMNHVKDKTFANVFELFIIGEGKKYYFFARDEDEKLLWCHDFETKTLLASGSPLVKKDSKDEEKLVLSSGISLSSSDDTQARRHSYHLKQLPPTPNRPASPTSSPVPDPMLSISPSPTVVEPPSPPTPSTTNPDPLSPSQPHSKTTGRLSVASLRIAFDAKAKPPPPKITINQPSPPPVNPNNKS